MSSYNWSSFTRRIDINADAPAVYRMWSTPEGIEKWFLRKCRINPGNTASDDPERGIVAGDRYTWWWHGWPDDVKEERKFLEANGIDTLQFTFGKVGEDSMNAP